MNHEDIIKLAREAGIYGTETGVATTFDDLEDFAALVAAKEREACAQVCVDAIASIRGFGTEDAKQTGINVCTNLVKAIRERGVK